MKTKVLWKKGAIVLLLVETFLLTIGVFIHEAVHSLDIFVLSGKFGEIHILDSTAFSYNTFAVCLLPNDFIINDLFPHELIAYGMTFLITGSFAILLIKKYYLKNLIIYHIDP